MPLGEVYPTYEAAMAYLNDPRLPPEAVGVTRGVERTPEGWKIVAYDQSGDRVNTPSEYAGLRAGMAESFTSDPTTEFSSYDEALQYYPDGVFEDQFVQRTTENAEERGFLQDLAKFMRERGYSDYGLQEPGGAYDQGVKSRQQSFDAVYGDRAPTEEAPSEQSTTEDTFLAAVSRMKPSQARAYVEDLMSKGMVPQGPRAKQVLRMLGADGRPSDADRQAQQSSPGANLDAPVPSGMTIRQVLERYGGG